MAVYLPKGTRDFLPNKMNNRLTVIRILREVFQRFGFEPIETPAFERIETLTGKYGDEGEGLMYRIQKRGEAGKRGETDLALRYDLTVPLARVMAMNPAIRLPFKRYQIQPVWRADRPQKGRFREFWQCDVDICGTHSLSADAECITVVAACLEALGFAEFTIRLNDRRILSNLAQLAGATTTEQETQVLVSLDKLDKIGQAGVQKELRSKGFSEEKLHTLWGLLQPQDTNNDTLDALHDRLGPVGQEGVVALRRVIADADALGLKAGCLKVDVSLARGLNYYTGPVFETVVTTPKIGAISGGGRYDGLIGMFSGRDVPAVGVSLGLERIITVMEELELLPSASTSTQVFVSVFSVDTRAASFEVTRLFRESGVRTELYLGESKLKAQMKYANARGFPWMAILGPDEIEGGILTLKNLKEGGQVQLSTQAAIEHLKKITEPSSH